MDKERLMAWATPPLIVLAALLIFALGYLIGAGHALDQMRQQAVDEGYATRDPEWRWRSSDELQRPRHRREP